MVESDGEVSQFDSLDNCSEGGMSAENFNTLKKGPLAPIDPPPEFQDSPQTTLVRSISKNIVNSLRRWTSSQSSFEHLKDDATTIGVTGPLPEEPQPELLLLLTKTAESSKLDAELSQLNLKESYALNKHLYSSDSILNSHTDNIYDEPNNIVSSSLGNSVDLLEEEQSEASSCSPLPSPPPPVSIVKIKQTLCPYYQDHTRYFKAIPTEQDTIASAKAAAAQQRFNSAGLSEIHDYDLYYGARRQPVDNSSLQRRQASLYSPLGHTSHCHYHNSHGHGSSHHHPHHHHHHHHHHQTAGYGYSHGQRPNSRNSLNSRLSSSHNSLNVSSANKPDDSIFITQAMSHDALFTREISDFYNVPIDSDIYAFPVDMIEQQQQLQLEQQQEQQKSSNAAPTYHKASRRNKRNKRKQRYGGTGAGAGTETSDGDGEKSKHGKYRTPVGTNVVVSESEPLHMTLDEVKQFYHTLYSDAGAGKASSASAKPMMVKSSNETIWSVSTNTTTTTARTRSSVGTTRAAGGAGGASSDGGVGAGGGGKYLSKQNKHNLDNDKLNNNNNNNNLQQTQQQTQQQQLQQQLEKPPTEHHNHTHNTHNNKHVLHSEKKSQFTLNLKQRFCSIFRFRRSNHSRCRGGGGGVASNVRDQAGTPASLNASTAATVPLIPPAAVITSAPGGLASQQQLLLSQQLQLATELNVSGGGVGATLTTAEAEEPNADLRKKFQSRALPPLPKKGKGGTFNLFQEAPLTLFFRHSCSLCH